MKHLSVCSLIISVVCLVQYVNYKIILSIFILGVLVDETFKVWLSTRNW